MVESTLDLRTQIIQAAEQLPSEDDRAKFSFIPTVIDQWMTEAGGITGKKILDFGCGSGTSAAGAALLFDAEVHGVDINNEAEACAPFLQKHFGVEVPDRLTFQEIAPGETPNDGPFDLIFSWSVFEHVNNRIYPSILEDLYNRLKPGGHFFVQISPLYFAPEGSHLWAIGYNRWEHLISQTSDVHDDVNNSDLSDQHKKLLLAMFDTLNRITADDLLTRFKAAGFELIREQRDQVDFEPPEELVRAYQRDALKTFQIVALFQKPLS
ncbi:cyclopropane-fatty-acyl-phospholipid synthase family protein [Roseibium sp. RKSG952]|uniref:SAM-dependent methyltransferase n=1 Tax=Roseibium sp. RKSG952 TaxID=2529384 RepID=UPI0012BB681F|nr:class I SAM-dependent methyltransferase [Roseibium sp. RKSG952]MTH99980.1 class I SAM-dependent methyltransferase [Roseibium sp. RKSG952]